MSFDHPGRRDLVTAPLNELGHLKVATKQLSIATRLFAEADRRRLVNLLKGVDALDAAAFLACSQPLNSALLAYYEPFWDWRLLSKNIRLPWTPEIVDRFEHRWDWTLLSANESLPWSMALLRRHENRWWWGKSDDFHDPSGLSGNTALPWCAELIEEQKHRWSFDALINNPSLQKYRQLIARVAPKLSLNDKIASKKGLSGFFEMDDDLSDSEEPPFPPTLNSIPTDRKYWKKISEGARPDWTIDLIERYESFLDWKALSGNSSIPWSIELIDRFRERWDWFEICGNEQLPWSIEFLSRYEDCWTEYCWRKLSEVSFLPWSEELLARFEDRWNWGSFWEDVENDHSSLSGLVGNDALPWSVSLIERYQHHWKGLWDKRISPIDLEAFEISEAMEYHLPVLEMELERRDVSEHWRDD